jgi:bifunctional DNA-binding transcriptional regulator/antitoxin component of YhaV-PrlF toxin-antitoxin module
MLVIQKCSRRRDAEQGVWTMESETLQVRKRGVVTLPAKLREKYGIEEGDTYRLVDLEGIFVITPMVPMVPEIAREIERLRLAAGLSMNDLLESLRQERDRFYREQQSGD